MKKKIMSIILTIVLCFNFAISASAESKAIDFVIDEFDLLQKGYKNTIMDIAKAMINPAVVVLCAFSWLFDEFV